MKIEKEIVYFIRKNNKRSIFNAIDRLINTFEKFSISLTKWWSELKILIG